MDSLSLLAKLKPLYQKSKINYEKLKQFRQDVHRHAEGGFNEIETSKKVVAHLLEYGLQDEFIKSCAKPGLVVDIVGTAAEKQEEKGLIDCIALRADMDALPMPEKNPHIDYQTITDHAHMCGHDGHTTCLLGIAEFAIKNRHKIPKNKKIRLFFQPAEELIGGANKMIEEGCLEGVNEVYGLHVTPLQKLGTILTKPGQFYAATRSIKIVIKGKGGHGSQPHICVNPLLAAARIILALSSLPSLEVSCQKKVVVSIASCSAGNANNVIPEEAIIRGTIRLFDSEIDKFIQTRISEIVHSLAKAERCEIDTSEPLITAGGEATINHMQQESYIRKVAHSLVGPEWQKDLERPFMGSQDFSEFIIRKPGSYFELGTSKEKLEAVLHTPYYNYDDDATYVGTLFWIRLVEERLGISLL